MVDGCIHLLLLSSFKTETFKTTNDHGKNTQDIGQRIDKSLHTILYRIVYYHKVYIATTVLLLHVLIHKSLQRIDVEMQTFLYLYSQFYCKLSFKSKISKIS